MKIELLGDDMCDEVRESMGSIRAEKDNGKINTVCRTHFSSAQQLLVICSG